jgi:hypothetical protein
MFPVLLSSDDPGSSTSPLPRPLVLGCPPEVPVDRLADEIRDAATLGDGAFT